MLRKGVIIWTHLAQTSEVLSAYRNCLLSTFMKRYSTVQFYHIINDYFLVAMEMSHFNLGGRLTLTYHAPESLIFLPFTGVFFKVFGCLFVYSCMGGSHAVNI